MKDTKVEQTQKLLLLLHYLAFSQVAIYQVFAPSVTNTLLSWSWSNIVNNLNSKNVRVTRSTSYTLLKAMEAER